MSKILLACGFAVMYLLGSAMERADLLQRQYQRRSDCQFKAQNYSLNELCKFYRYADWCAATLPMELGYKAYRFEQCFENGKGVTNALH